MGNCKSLSHAIAENAALRADNVAMKARSDTLDARVARLEEAVADQGEKLDEHTDQIDDLEILNNRNVKRLDETIENVDEMGKAMAELAMPIIGMIAIAKARARAMP